MLQDPSINLPPTGCIIKMILHDQVHSFMFCDISVLIQSRLDVLILVLIYLSLSVTLVRTPWLKSAQEDSVCGWRWIQTWILLALLHKEACSEPVSTMFSSDQGHVTTFMTTACPCIFTGNTKYHTFNTKREKKKGGALTDMYWRKYSVAGNVYKILRKFSWSINPLDITVILFWSLEYFHCDNMTTRPDSQSCTELVTWCEQQRQLQSTLFVMMRHCEYSSCYAYYLQRVRPLGKLNECETTVVMFDRCG